MSKDILKPFAQWRYKRAVSEANTARSARDWPNAYKNYRKAVEIQPEAAAIWVQCGHAAKEMGEFAAAERAYEAAKRLVPTDIDLRIQLGHLLKEAGRHADALAHYKAALAAGSSDVHAADYVFRCIVSDADAMREDGRLKRAVSLYQEALSTRPDFGLFMHMGNCLRDLGEVEAALKSYSAAHELEPEDPECLAQLNLLAKHNNDINSPLRELITDSVSNSLQTGHDLLDSDGSPQNNHALIASARERNIAEVDGNPGLSRDVWLIRKRIQHAYTRRRA